MRSFHVLTMGAVLLGSSLTTTALAESMPLHDHSRTPNQTQQAPSTKAFEEANMTMHRNMSIRYTGNADMDFAKAMIAHHQGAIDMAKVELKYGSAPEMRTLAKSIIDAQEHEIDQMQRWVKDNSSSKHL